MKGIAGLTLLGLSITSVGFSQEISTLPPPPTLSPSEMPQEGSLSPGEAAGVDLATLRDPFKRPRILLMDATPRSELEYYPVEQYRLVGVLTGPEKLRAMVVGPDGKTHFVSEKAKIGVRKGVIVKISPQAIKVREKILNTIGKEETVMTELRMPGGAANGQMN